VLAQILIIFLINVHVSTLTISGSQVTGKVEENSILWRN
jgi:hypothetical protein